MSLQDGTAAFFERSPNLRLFADLNHKNRRAVLNHDLARYVTSPAQKINIAFQGPDDNYLRAPDAEIVDMLVNSFEITDPDNLPIKPEQKIEAYTTIINKINQIAKHPRNGLSRGMRAQFDATARLMETTGASYIFFNDPTPKNHERFEESGESLRTVLTALNLKPSINSAVPDVRALLDRRKNGFRTVAETQLLANAAYFGGHENVIMRFLKNGDLLIGNPFNEPLPEDPFKLQESGYRGRSGIGLFLAEMCAQLGGFRVYKADPTFNTPEIRDVWFGIGTGVRSLVVSLSSRGDKN